MDEMAHFDRERIPERVVHAKGAGELRSTIIIYRIAKNFCGLKILRIAVRRPSADNISAFTHSFAEFLGRRNF